MFDPNVTGQEPLFEMPGACARAVDVDDTDRCPTGSSCWICDRTVAELSVVTAGCQLGVFCMSVCETCLDAGVVPDMGPHMVFDLVGRHCGHLGIDLDQMAVLTGRGEA